MTTNNEAPYGADDKNAFDVRHILVTTMLGVVVLVATSTIALVWVYHNPAISGILTEQTTQKDDLKYIRQRVDDIYKAIK